MGVWSSAWASARIAVRALRVNKLRSALTMLGIVIGVGAVITMVAVGAGAQARVAEQIQSLGSNMLIVLSGSVLAGGVRMGSGSQLTITEDDAWAIQREIPAVAAAAPTSRGGAQVVSGNLNWATGIQGVTLEFFTAREWDVVDGRLFSQEEIDGAGKVALLGQTVSGNLFGDGEPLGQVIRIKNVPFTVIGLLEHKGQTTFGQDQDDTVLIPLSTAEEGPGREPGQRARGGLHRGQGARGARDAGGRAGDSRAAAPAAPPATAPGRRLQHPQPDRGAAVAVSVTERTREIGLRMAVGARGRDILLQFLVEAVTLSLIGGVVGITTGLAGSYAIAHFARWRTLVSPEAVLVAFGFAAAVGVFFGFYPARKAAALDPIEALRYE